jgi:hypothetical protein
VRESKVEERLRVGLEGKGFKVLKLTCPGTNGVPDRMILRPKWSPGPPWYIELKAPKKHEARLQEIIRQDWRERGARVLNMVDTYAKVDALIDDLYHRCVHEAL